MVPAWRRSSRRKRLSFSSSRLPRTSRTTSAIAVEDDGGADDGGTGETDSATLAARRACKGASIIAAPAPATTTCGRRQTKANPRAKRTAKPATRYHFKPSRRAGNAVAVTEGASDPGASTREFTEGFCASCADGGALTAPPLPVAPPAFAGIGAVPETETLSGVFAATDSRM